MSDTEPTIQEILEREFCPPLDSALIAACAIDYPQDTKEQRDDALENLRTILSQLAVNAAADQDPESPQSSRESSQVASRNGYGSAFESNGEELVESSATSAIDTGSSDASPSDSALDFLRASFPHLPVEKLEAKLKAAETRNPSRDELGMDMETLVAEILSEEFIRELEERGVKDEDELAEQMGEWQVVQRKSSGQAKKKRKGKTITLSDVRQQQHVPSQRVPNPHPAGDPWSQLSSIASYLETLLTPHKSTLFLSYFHKPEYLRPADALRAALTAIAQDQPSNRVGPKTNIFEPSLEEVHEEALCNLIELLCSKQRGDFQNFEDEARERLCEDADLALRAAKDQPDVAVDIVNLLQDLDVDGDSVREMGVYHSPVTPLPASPKPMTSPSKSSAVSTPSTSTWKAPLNHAQSQPAASAVHKPKPPPWPNQAPQKNNDWQQVKIRPKQTPNPLAVHIPAYDPYNGSRRKARGAGNATGKGGKGDVGELRSPPPSGSARAFNAPSFRNEPRLVNGAISRSAKRSINEVRTQRHEALRQASRHWAKGNTRNHGGEIAWHYALEAQKYQEEARRLKLDAARDLVEGKRNSNTNRETIDLHYCTAAEAVTIVHEVLDEGWVCASRPLRIITGRGSHSTNKIGVLGPAVTGALEREGWRIRQWDGGLIVHGRG